MPTKNEQEILTDISNTLSKIYELLLPVIKKSQEYEKVDPIGVHESKGSCPNCESVSVELTYTVTCHPIYKCSDCELVWVNDEEAIKSITQ